jgi:hypothetical protein
MFKRLVGPALTAVLLVGLLPTAVLAATGPRFEQQPGGGAPGVAWAQQPSVAIKTGNNIDEGATGQIDLSITAGTGSAGAVLTCTVKPMTLAAGVATFAGCKIDKAGTGYRLTATWTGGGGGTMTSDSNAFNITAPSGTATKLGFSAQPARGTPGSAFAVQPSVAIQDASGTTVTGAPPTSISLSLGANPGGSTLTCAPATTVNGVATFSGCRLDKVGVGYTLVATATGLASATSAQFDVADRLAFTTQPAGAIVGTAFPTQPVVAVRAGATATATHDNGTTVTLSIKNGTGTPGAVLTCTSGLTRTAVAGVATFSGCAISKAGTGYILEATSSGLTTATSSALNVGGVTLTITNSASVITWGSQISIAVRFDQAGAGRSIQVQGSRDGTTWTTVTTLLTDANGSASSVYAPVTNLYYRAVFAGAPNLGAQTSATVRTVVRQISLLRSINRGLVLRVSRGTSVTFTDTVRPARPELPKATVRFVFYRRDASGIWRLYSQRDIVIDSLGKAVTNWNFPSNGEWYVRSQARPTPYNANSVWAPLQRFSVH